MADWRDWLLKARDYGRGIARDVRQVGTELNQTTPAITNKLADAQAALAPSPGLAPPIASPPAPTALAPYERVNPAYQPGDTDAMIQSTVGKMRGGPRY